MRKFVSFIHVLAVAGFAGGCLCLSVTLGALLLGSPEDGARVMRMLLPRMGALMAPLLGASAISGLVLAIGSSLARNGAAESRELRRRWLVVGNVLVILGVTLGVHLPLNGELLQAALPTHARATLVLERWLLWHHLRTALALFALGVLLWPLQSRAVRSEALRST